MIGVVGNLKVIIELFAYIYCLAELYGQKLKIGIHAVVFIIVDLFWMVGINDFGFPEYFSSLGYIAMVLYGLTAYKESIKNTLVNCFLAAIIVSILQLLFYLPLHYLLFYESGREDLNELLTNVFGFIFIVLCSHRVKLNQLSEFCQKRNKLIFIVTTFILFGLGFNFYKIIEERALLREAYIQMVYFVLIFSFVMYEWQKSRADVEKKKAQLEMNRLYYDAYDNLIMLIRERQHDMKSHINTILNLAYTTESYDELVAKQREYCGYVMEQNKKTKLVLSSGNPLIAGFLYSVIQEAESHNIEVEYQIGIRKNETVIPEYELVDISGILLDNAIEAFHNIPEDFDKKIFYSIKETESSIVITVANTSPYYEADITSHFFEAGYSSKGQNRGIGLSKLKRHVQDRKGNIIVYNELRSCNNFLTFVVDLPK